MLMSLVKTRLENAVNNCPYHSSILYSKTQLNDIEGKLGKCD